jgi:hypothetical protein
MYSTVPLVPGVVIFTEFDVTGRPLPKSPIWLYADELQLGGWQMAEIDAAPAKLGVTDPPALGETVDGTVETYSSDRPVRVAPRVSLTVATIGCGVFSLTTTGEPVVPGVDSVIEAGGQVEKMPAELAAFDMFAEIRTDPGWLAVATPFWSTLSTVEIAVVEAAPCVVY